MKTGNSIATAAAMALMAVAMHPSTSSAQAAATDAVVIGVIDTRAEAHFEGLDIQYRHFGVPTHREGVERMNPKMTHGDVVLKSIADARTAMGDERPYRIMFANPFVEGPEGRLLMNYKGLTDAVAWFKQNGVRIVSTTFVSPKDTPGMAAFSKAAGEAGILVVASIGNGGSKEVPYPAAYATSLAVDGWHYRKPKDSYYADVTRRIDVTFDGSTGVKNRPNGRDAHNDDAQRFTAAPDASAEVRGSSFAVAKATALLAATLGDRVDLQSAKAFMAPASRDRTPFRIDRLEKATVDGRMMASNESQDHAGMLMASKANGR